MGKYASRDGAGSVAWADITGKPATFTPSAHSNTAHSTEYAPLANPTFTGTISYTNSGNGSVVSPSSTNIFMGAGAGAFTGIMALNSFNDDFASWLQFSIRNGGGTKVMAMTLDRIGNVVANRGLHVGGESDPGDNNILADGTITGAKLQTANYSWEEDGTDLVLKNGSTIIARMTSAGYWKTKDNQEPKASMA